MHERESVHYDAVISGMGPAGLCAAWEAIRAGKSVCLITNRKVNEHTRGQKVFLQGEVRDYLRLMFNSFPRTATNLDPEDSDFLKQIDANRGVSINKVEEYLLRRVKELETNQLKIIEQSTLTDVQLSSGEATIVDYATNQVKNAHVSFDVLIGADGIHHHAVDEVNQNLPEKQRINYQRDFKRPHKYHASVFVPTIKKTDESPIILSVKRENETEDARIHVGKDGLYVAIIFAQTSNDNTEIECNINCEIPRDLYYRYYEAKADYTNATHKEVPDQNQIKNLKQNYQAATEAIKIFIKEKILAELKLSDADVQFNPDEGGDIDFKPFVTILNQASKAFVSLQGKTFIVIGDSYRAPYYPLGHGINDALLEAKFLAKIFTANPQEQQQKLKDYEKMCKELGSTAKLGAAIGSSIFKKLVWKKSEKKAEQIFREYQIDREQPYTHRAILKENWSAILNGVRKNDKLQLYTQNKQGQNILHFALGQDVHHFILGENSSEKFQNNHAVLKWLYQNENSIFQKLITQKDGNGYTPIHLFAMQKTAEDAIDNLLILAPSKNDQRKYRDENNNTFAHIAAQNGMPHLKLLQFLFIQAPEIFKAKNDEGFTPIEIMYKSYKTLVDMGDFPKKQEDTYTAIFDWANEKKLGSKKEALEFDETTSKSPPMGP